MNLIETNFLDVMFLISYISHIVNQTTILYTCQIKLSSIIKDLPKMINKRLSGLSCDEDEFKRAKPLYENALKEI